MTLTLQHEEVQRYFDLHSDLEYYKNKVDQLEKSLHDLQIKYEEMEESYFAHITEPTEEELDDMEQQFQSDMFGLPSVSRIIAGYTDGEAREDRKGRAWDDLDIHIIRMAVGKDHEAFRISSLATILDRTVQAIASKAIELGFHTKNDRIRFK